MRALRFLLLPAAFVLSSTLAAQTAAAEERTPAPQRRDPTLFGAGLATAITGGVALNAGALLFLWGDVKCAFCDVSDKAEADRLQAAGVGIAVVGVLMIAAGIPMAIVGGRKEVVAPPPAAQNGLVPILTF